MPETVVNMGHLALIESPERLSSNGIGSCVCVAIYDTKKKQGGLAHVMLPEREGRVKLRLTIAEDVSTSEEKEQKAKYAKEAVDELMIKLKAKGSLTKNLEAKLVGGAEMFEVFKKSQSETLGSRNVSAVKEALDSYEIPIVAENTGGSSGRSLVFYARTGDIEVKTVL